MSVTDFLLHPTDRSISRERKRSKQRAQAIPASPNEGYHDAESDHGKAAIAFAVRVLTVFETGLANVSVSRPSTI